MVKGPHNKSKNNIHRIFYLQELKCVEEQRYIWHTYTFIQLQPDHLITLKVKTNWAYYYFIISRIYVYLPQLVSVKYLIQNRWKFKPATMIVLVSWLLQTVNTSLSVWILIIAPLLYFATLFVFCVCGNNVNLMK